MGRGRPPKGLSHVDSLEVDEEAKARLKAILATLGGELSVKEACAELGVSESRFHALRQSALQGLLAGLAPRPPGRPAKEREPPEVTALRERVAWLEEELEISRLRTEVAMENPSLLRIPARPGKKGGASSKRRDRRRRRRGGRGGT
jgi:transposase-like protein